jgi:hypothetical protein
MNAPGELHRFQDLFARALFEPEVEAVSEITALIRQPGFSVYRNTVIKSCIDAIQGNYPTVARLVGDDWLRAAASGYVGLKRPNDSRLLFYGEDFPEFLEDFEPAAELPYLAGVARLDRMWSIVHTAPGALPLDPAVLSALAPEALGTTVLYPHAAARWQWFDEQPIYSIWKRNRESQTDGGRIDWQGEGALLLRPKPSGDVFWIGLDAAGCAFLDACSAGRPLAEAAADALNVEKYADIAQLLAMLLRLGAFDRIGQINEKNLQRNCHEPYCR